MREIRLSGSAGGGAELNRLSLPYQQESQQKRAIVKGSSSASYFPGRATTASGFSASRTFTAFSSTLPRNQIETPRSIKNESAGRARAATPVALRLNNYRS